MRAVSQKNARRRRGSGERGRAKYRLRAQEKSNSCESDESPSHNVRNVGTILRLGVRAPHGPQRAEPWRGGDGSVPSAATAATIGRFPTTCRPSCSMSRRARSCSAHGDVSGVRRAASSTRCCTSCGPARSGHNPTDRANSGTKRHIPTEGCGVPIAIAIIAWHTLDMAGPRSCSTRASCALRLTPNRTRQVSSASRPR